MKARGAAILAAVLLALAAGARAEQYPGVGDTGWAWGNKRDCCAHAVALAEEDSVARCYSVGGRPRPTSGQRRGACQWQASQDGWGNALFRCYAEAAVWCR